MFAPITEDGYCEQNFMYQPGPAKPSRKAARQQR
jgi:hypothetical protein